MGKTTKKPSPQTQEDLEYLSTILAKGVSGLVEVAITDGLKMGTTLRRLTQNKENDELIARLWTKFWLVNPRATSIIEAVALMSPGFGEMLERLRMKAKTVPPEDVQVKDEPPVKDAEPC
jgi:hypothetical protein